MKQLFKSAWLGAVLLALAAPAAAQQFTMKLSSPTANDVQMEWMKTFKSGVETRTGGRIKVEIYPANQLGPIPRTVEGVALGTIELTAPATGFLVGLEPRFNVFDAFGLFDSVEHGMKVLSDPDIQRRLASFGEAKGIEVLFVALHSPNVLVSRRDVRAIADMRGMRIRVPASPLQIEPLKRLGASPLSMPLGEVLPALQNGTIDGAMLASTVATAFKYFDAAKGMTWLPQSWIVVGGIVNRKWMASLGRDLESIVREEARKADATWTAWGVPDTERARRAWETSGGRNIVLPAAEAKRFTDEVATASDQVLAANPQIKADFDALTAAARKYR